MSLIRQSFVALPDAELQWNRFETLIRSHYHDFFDGEGPIAGARAPGRLDVMGGVADYSGSIVLEMPMVRLRAVPTLTRRAVMLIFWSSLPRRPSAACTATLR